MGLTFSCVEVCENILKDKEYEVKHICINKKKINKCFACGERGWGICKDEHKCIQKDDFNGISEFLYFDFEFLDYFVDSDNPTIIEDNIRKLNRINEILN